MREWLVIFVCIQPILSAFWNEIPSKCIYNRERLLFCRNTTFSQSIPLFNDLSYTFDNHHVDIRYSELNLTLDDLLGQVAANIADLSLIGNRLLVHPKNKTKTLYFRSLKAIRIYQSGWSQLNSSIFPQLTDVDLSFNMWTDKDVFRFDDDYFPQLKLLNFSYNQLESIDSITGTALTHVETLIVSFNPLTSITNSLYRYESLKYFDLSSTSIKFLFELSLLPHLEMFHCRQCQLLENNEYERFLVNCSQHNQHLRLDLSETTVSTVKIFERSTKCFQELILNDLSSLVSITDHDLRYSYHLQSIEIQNSNTLEFVHLNVYDRLTSVNFNGNLNLNQFILKLMSNFTYLQQLTISRTSLTDFSIDFTQTTFKFLHIDVVDLSFNHLETVEFLRHLIFSRLDLTNNYLKIVDLHEIQYPHGMYDASLMNYLNLSSNSIESIEIHWINESPHLIDLSDNQLRSLNLQGQTTYSLRLNKNLQLSFKPNTVHINFPSLQYLDLSLTNLSSLEQLIYLHNLSNIHTLILDNNYLQEHHRILNWNIFFPWHQHLTHVSLQNISLERIDSGFHLMNYEHLLTINLDFNEHLKCDCSLQPFIEWLKYPPPILPDIYEPLQKLLRIQCPKPLFEIRCDGDQPKLTIRIILIITLVILIVSVFLLFIFVLRCKRYICQRPVCQSYERVLAEVDVFALSERNSSS